MVENLAEKKVLFLHGLESGHKGRKYQAIRKSFTSVSSMDMSSYCNLRKNWIYQPFFALIPILISIPSIPLIADTTPQKWTFFSLIALPCVVAIVVCLRIGIRSVIRNCMRLQLKEIEAFQPDIIVGSSFGGAIAAFLILEGHWHGPALLLAPAYSIILRWSRFLWVTPFRPSVTSEGSSALIVVGLSDKLITVKDSSELQQALVDGGHHSRLVTVDDAHSLSRLCKPAKGISDWIEVAIKFHEAK